MQRMGHSTVRVALIYQHAADERDQKIAEALDELIGELKWERAAERDEGVGRDEPEGSSEAAEG